MSRRIFVNVSRGPMDKTPTCIYPWEADILQLIHGQEIKEVTIDEMIDLGSGVVTVEPQRTKHSKVPPPDLRVQLELMQYVSPEDDPTNDPGREYNRLADKYGMDKEFPIPCVERIYGQFSSGAFEAKLKKFAKDRIAKPQFLVKLEEEEAAEAAA